ncbi:MAG: hypothetical protein E7161_04370 [Firmicutes bacterium]|nr:hypothetical protein [Bacillota bacterium]
MNEGFILLHRRIIKEWEWYSNINDTRLWVHCLLRANWEDNWYDGILIKRGSFMTSYKSLSSETGLTIQQVRTSLAHLKKTDNLTIENNRQYSIITIKNYDKYQCEQQTNNTPITHDQHTSNTRVTTNNKDNKDNKYNKKENIKEKRKYGTFKRVVLTDDEYARLVSDYGEEFVINQIVLLDEYIESNNNKNKYTNFNLVLRKSIREQWFKSKTKVPEWYDKNTEKKQDTEKLGELEEILKEFE